MDIQTPEESTVIYSEEISPSDFFEQLFIVVVGNGNYFYSYSFLSYQHGLTCIV